MFLTAFVARSRWARKQGVPDPDPVVSETPLHEPERRSRLLLRRLYDELPADAKLRLRADAETHNT